MPITMVAFAVFAAIVMLLSVFGVAVFSVAGTGESSYQRSIRFTPLDTSAALPITKDSGVWHVWRQF